MQPELSIERKMKKKRPILRMWLKLLAIFVGCLCFTIFALAPLFIFLIAPYLPIIAIFVLAIGFGISARRSQKRTRKTMCLRLCIACIILGIVGFPLWSRFFVFRPEPSIQEAQKILQSHQATLKSAADAIAPGNEFPGYPRNEKAARPEVHAALNIAGVTDIFAEEEGTYVRFTLHHTNYFGHEGDYRYLFYVPTDEIELFMPKEFKGTNPIEEDDDSRYYVLQKSPRNEEFAMYGGWYDEWYVERVSAGWFYAASDSVTTYPAQGKKRFGAM